MCRDPSHSYRAERVQRSALPVLHVSVDPPNGYFHNRVAPVTGGRIKVAYAMDACMDMHVSLCIPRRAKGDRLLFTESCRKRHEACGRKNSNRVSYVQWVDRSLVEQQLNRLRQTVGGQFSYGKAVHRTKASRGFGLESILGPRERLKGTEKVACPLFSFPNPLRQPFPGDYSLFV